MSAFDDFPWFHAYVSAPFLKVTVAFGPVANDAGWQNISCRVPLSVDYLVNAGIPEDDLSIRYAVSSPHQPIAGREATIKARHHTDQLDLLKMESKVPVVVQVDSRNATPLPVRVRAIVWA
jgi:hypothetical protein